MYHYSKYVSIVGLALMMMTLSVTQARELLRGPGVYDVTTWYDSVVDLLDEDGTTQICTGVLVHPQWVLTARHCVDDPELGDHEIVFAKMKYFKTGGSSVTREVVEEIRRAGYMKAGSYQINDLAMLKLDNPVIGVSLPNLTPLIPDTSSLKLLGWGLTASGPTNNLQATASFDLVSSAECAKEYGIPNSGFKPEHGLICAKDPSENEGSGACGGDSGGPLFAEKTHESAPYLLGIASFGEVDSTNPNCLKRDIPVAFQDVRFHYDWIMRVIDAFTD